MSTGKGLLLLVALATAAGVASANAEAAAPDRLAMVTFDQGGATAQFGSNTAVTGRHTFRGAKSVVLSADAQRLAYTRMRSGAVEVRVARVDGRSDTLLARVRPSAVALAFTPDGSRIAYTDGAGIATVRIDGTDRRRLRLPAFWRGSRFTQLVYGPDGRRIFFSRTTGNLRKGTLRNELDVFYLGRAVGTTLFHSPDAFEMPVRPVSIGLDGEYVLVDGGGPIWLVPLQAGRNRVLTTPPTDGSDHSPLVSPDGRQVAFARIPDGGVSDVYLVNVEGTRLSRLTTTPTPPRGTPKVGVTPLAWSPDATKLLVFRHDRLAIVDVATGESTDVGQVGVRFWIASARWFGAPPVPSSRGTIVFERSAEGGTADLYTVRADGTDLHRLTSNLRSYDPAWSPNGDRIAFTGGGTLDRQLFVMNADGSGTMQLTQLAPREGAWDPFWYRADPFGLRIAFKLITRPPGAIENTSVLYGIDPDGKGAAPIAAPGDLTHRSPDGRRIVKLLYTGGLHGSLIVVSDVDGTGVCTIGWGWSPAWSPDGSSIVYGAGDGLFTRRADGLGPPRRLTRAGKLELDLSPSWTE